MLPSDRALRALLSKDFDALSCDVELAPQIEQIVALIMDTTLRVVRDLAAHWNTKNAAPHISSEVLALCFTLLPFRDRIRASHVSRFWRHAALEHPEVWAQIDLSDGAPDKLSLLSMALERSGQHPLDLKYGDSGEQPEIARAVERHMHRMRALEWKSPDMLILDQPFPQLESVKSNTVFVSERFLTGHPLRLHTLHVPFHCLPKMLPGPIYSVKDFAGHLATYGDATAPSMLPHIFELFPRMEALTLSGLESPLSMMPASPPPRSLVRLRLNGASANGGDLAEQSLAWQTAQLKEVELCINPNTYTGEYACRRVRPFFASALELCIGPWKEHRVCLAGRDAQGRTHVLSFNEDALRNIGRNAAFVVPGSIWFSIGDAYALLTSVSLAAAELDEMIKAGGRFPSVHTLVITLQRLYQLESNADSNDGSGTRAALEKARLGYPWSSLSVFGSLPSHFPALNAFVLELQSSHRADSPSAFEVRYLLQDLAAYGVPGLPVLHIRGIAQDVVLGLDQDVVQELPIKIEFEMSPSYSFYST